MHDFLISRTGRAVQRFLRVIVASAVVGAVGAVTTAVTHGGWTSIDWTACLAAAGVAALVAADKYLRDAEEAPEPPKPQDGALDLQKP